MHARWQVKGEPTCYIRTLCCTVGWRSLFRSCQQLASHDRHWRNILREEHPPQWLANELHAANDAVDRRTTVDVNDRFVVRSATTDGLTKVAFGVLDGMRERYGTCGDGNDPQLGDRHTTWVEIAYSNIESDGSRDITVRRTLDFYGNERTYRFRSSGDDEIAHLEPGISIEFEDGVATYVQTTGPIGMSGETEAIRLAYKLSDSYDAITTTVELDHDMWSIMTDGANGSEQQVVSVNEASIVTHSAIEPRSGDGDPVIAAPMFGPGVVSEGQLPILLVADQGDDQREIDDVETTDEERQSLCFAFRCITRIDCLSGGPRCYCASLGGGPGVCLI